mmetsp:Transcript_29860/g.46824  ORF Transcript_29860/g.46824 Transcript_29860/m.46824 type:complete len:87 (+) Transcript_29860:69-329(+)
MAETDHQQDLLRLGANNSNQNLLSEDGTVNDILRKMHWRWVVDNIDAPTPPTGGSTTGQGGHQVLRAYRQQQQEASRFQHIHLIGW